MHVTGATFQRYVMKTSIDLYEISHLLCPCYFSLMFKPQMSEVLCFSTFVNFCMISNRFEAQLLLRKNQFYVFFFARNIKL